MIMSVYLSGEMFFYTQHFQPLQPYRVSDWLTPDQKSAMVITLFFLYNGGYHGSVTIVIFIYILRDAIFLALHFFLID